MSKPGSLDVGTRVRVSYVSKQSGNRVERGGEVYWNPTDDGSQTFVETDEGSRLTVDSHYVTVNQPGSDYGNSRLIGTDPEVEVDD